MFESKKTLIQIKNFALKLLKKTQGLQTKIKKTFRMGYKYAQS